MRDFLTRLAERTLGVAPIARPDLTPVFAPATSEPATDAEVKTIDAASNRAPASPARQSPSSSVEGLSAEVHLEAAIPSEKVQLAPDTMPVAEEPSRSPVREPEKPGIVHHSTHNATPSRQRPMVMQSQLSATTKQAAANDYPASPIPPIVTTHVPSSLDTKWTESSPPTINVTIGRIEVRAVTPAPPPRAERRPPALQSLNEYLRARNEGRR